MIMYPSYVTIWWNTIQDLDGVYYESVLCALFLFHVSEKSDLSTFTLSKAI